MWTDVRCDTPTRMGTCGKLLFRRGDDLDGRVEIKCLGCKQVKDIRLVALYYATT